MRKELGKKAMVLGICMLALLFAGAAFAAEKEGAYPDNISFISGGAGGTYYFIGTGVAKALNDKFEGVSCAMESTSSAPLENATLVSRATETIGIITLDGILDALSGNPKTGFRAPITNIKVIMGGHIQFNYLGAKKGSGIKTIADMAGKRFGTLTKSSSIRQQSEALLIAQGLDPEKDLKITVLTYPEQVDAIKDDKIDIFNCGGGSPQAMIMEIATSSPIELLTIPKELEDKMLAAHPYWRIATIPAGTYAGQDEDARVTTVQTLIVANENLSDKFIYDLMEVVFANNDILVGVHPEGKSWSWETTLDFYERQKDALPWHPGAIKYIEERAAK